MTADPYAAPEAFGDPRERQEPSLPIARHLDSCPKCRAALPGRPSLSCPHCGVALDDREPQA